MFAVLICSSQYLLWLDVCSGDLKAIKLKFIKILNQIRSENASECAEFALNQMTNNQMDILIKL